MLKIGLTQTNDIFYLRFYFKNQYYYIFPYIKNGKMNIMNSYKIQKEGIL